MELKLIRLIKNLPSLDTSNCTNMELKHFNGANLECANLASNCTNMELKLVLQPSPALFCALLIAPIWN